MAVSWDAITYHTGGSVGAGTISWTHTPSGTPSAATISLRKTGAGQITGVTYGGTAMTRIVQEGTGNPKTEIWGLATVASGAQTVVVTTDGSATIFAYSQSWTGTHLTTASCFTSPQSDSGGVAAGTSTLTVTSAADDLVTDFVRLGTSPSTDKVMDPGTGQTERGENFESGPTINIAASTKPGAASVEMSYGWATSTNVDGWGYVACNIVQAAAGGGGRIFKLAGEGGGLTGPSRGLAARRIHG
jgi:hypothetical protein